MLIKHMAACLLATSLVAAPALAQSTGDRPAASDNRTGTLGSPSMNAPGTTAPSASTSTMGSSSTTAQAPAPAPAPAPAAPPAGGASMAGGSGMTQLQSGQFLASDLIGTRVVGQNNESIGDVNDVVMGPDGKAMAILVGVGGFLGIGEKDVAIPFDQAKVMFDNNDRAANASGSTSAPNTTGSTGTAGSTAGGGMGASGGNTAASNASAAANEPQRIVINMTKEQLQQASAFRTGGGSNDSSSGSSGSSTAPAGGNTAPRQ